MRFHAVETLFLAGAVLAAAGTSSCGGDPDTPGRSAWQHATVERLAHASGLAVQAGFLLAVAGGDDRDVYVVRTDMLRRGASLRAHTLALDITPSADLGGAEPFARQGYRMSHLWDVPLDFVDVAVLAPHHVFLADRIRRVAFAGRVLRDAAGQPTRVKLDRVVVVPGADRRDVERGDWRDKGPGLAGLAALTGERRVEDLFAVDRGPAADGSLRLGAMDRYGSRLGDVRVEGGIPGGGEVRGLSVHAGRFVLLVGPGRGRLVSCPRPVGSEPVALGPFEDTPEVDGVARWVAVAHGADGTLHLLSDGEPAVLAWR